MRRERVALKFFTKDPFFRTYPLEFHCQNGSGAMKRIQFRIFDFVDELV